LIVGGREGIRCNRKIRGVGNADHIGMPGGVNRHASRLVAIRRRIVRAGAAHIGREKQRGGAAFGGIELRNERIGRQIGGAIVGALERRDRGEIGRIADPRDIGVTRRATRHAQAGIGQDGNPICGKIRRQHLEAIKPLGDTTVIAQCRRYSWSRESVDR